MRIQIAEFQKIQYILYNSGWSVIKNNTCILKISMAIQYNIMNI